MLATDAEWLFTDAMATKGGKKEQRSMEWLPNNDGTFYFCYVKKSRVSRHNLNKKANFGSRAQSLKGVQSPSLPI